MSQDISHRERRYLIMMGIRLVCFVAAIALYANGGGWLALIPAVGAIIIPYIAVVFANGGREPSKARGLQDYEPYLPSGSTTTAPRQATPSHIVGFVTYPEADPEPGRGGDEARAGSDPAAGHHPRTNGQA